MSTVDTSAAQHKLFLRRVSRCSEEPESLSPGVPGRGCIVATLVVPGVAARLSSRALPFRPPVGNAGEEDDELGEEEEDHGGEAGPHADGVEGVGAAAVFVDVVFDDLDGFC
jgi:hypothetical protein